jgi:imidazolonepropionase-like amidohydrolase
VVLLFFGLFAYALDVPAPLAELETSSRKPIEPALEADPPHVVLSGATVFTATGVVHEPGYVEIRDGRIAAVGQGSGPSPDGAIVVDVDGKFITPGLIDTHSHLGVYPSPGAKAHSDGNEMTSPNTAGVWAEHSTWPQDPGFQRAIAGGVTTLQILPGSANLIGGRGVIVQVVPARGSRQMRFPGAPETIKMACGENPKRVYGAGKNTAPSTRMGNLRGQRQAYLDAQAYQRQWEAYAKKLAWHEEHAADKQQAKKRKKSGTAPPTPPVQPDRDLNKETLVGVLAGEILPQIHCYRADDMLSMLQLADEFGFKIRSFHHAVEAYKIRDVLVEQDVAVSTWADWWGFKLEAYDAIMENLALIHEAGGHAIVHSDSAVGIQRLNQEAAKAYYVGVEAGIELKEDDAIRWITANPAWALGIQDQTGSLEAGKRADIAVWDGHPLSIYTRADKVFVAGLLRYDQTDNELLWSDFELGQEVR